MTARLTAAQADLLRRIRDVEPRSFRPYGSEWRTAYKLSALGLIQRDSAWNVCLTSGGRSALEAAS